MNSPEKKEQPKYGTKYIKQFVLDIFDLRKGVDKLGTIEEIKAKKSLSGANAWMLMCSIIIASIGLDRNSDAVIIGAMLISPLMSPILGIGLGVGINDKDVIKKSIIHYSAAIIIAIVTSFVYFKLTPFGEVTPAIQARTAPDTLDVLVALFGGLAGIISIARKDISTTLPGVAIATALMPPLCVTGFELANSNWSLALSSFYLLVLNTFFISLSTYAIIRYLRFPYKRYLRGKERTRNQLVVAITSLVIIIPSFYILNNVLFESNEKAKIEDFINHEFEDEKLYLDSYTVLKNDSTSTIVLKVYGDEINTSKVGDYKKSMQDFGLSSWDIRIIPSSEVDLNKIASLDKKIEQVQIFSENIEKKRLEAMKLDQKERIDSTNKASIIQELTTLFPSFKQISLTTDYYSNDSLNLPILIIEHENEDDEMYYNAQNLSNFVNQKLQADSTKIIFTSSTKAKPKNRK